MVVERRWGHEVLTVRTALRLPEFRAGRPRVVGGSAGLDRTLRWVHVSELPEVGRLLHGGELVLTTGLGLDRRPEGLRRWIRELAAVEASGVVLELGERFPETTEVLRSAADEVDLPLVELHREVRFVDITLAVHARILTRQLGDLQRAEEVNQVLHQLVIEGATPTDILERAGAMVGRPLVLENLSHQVVAVAPAGQTLDRLLEGWEGRSRRTDAVANGSRARVVDGLAIVPVDGRHGRLGRLAMVTPTDDPLERVVLRRAADAVAMARGQAGAADGLDAAAHGSLLADLLARRWSAADDLVVRARALGVELADRPTVGMVVRFPAHPDDAAHRGADLVRRAVRAIGVPALVAALDDSSVAVLAGLAPDPDHRAALARIATAIHEQVTPSGAVDVATIGVGPLGKGLVAVADSLREARQVADGAAATSPPRSYHTMRDIRIRGLVHLLRDDERLQAFVERELETLLRHDHREGTRLVETLRVWLDHGGNKSAAADALYLSRPALYQRLEQVERILDRDLDDVETRLSLHVAVLALAALRAGSTIEPTAR